mgnify:CR=1 FL=1
MSSGLRLGNQAGTAASPMIATAKHAASGSFVVASDHDCIIDRAEANRRLDASFDHDTAMHAYRDFAKRGVFVTPTLNGGRILLLTADGSATVWPDVA